MLKFFMTKRERARGFTLIELLVVIAIIGVLASIVLASLNNARRKSRDARRITDIKQIQLALELYFDGVGAGAYPQSSATCDAATNRKGLEVLSTNNYIPSVPRDPGAGVVCYSYAAPVAPATTYHLGGTLEDTANPALNGDRDCNSSVNPPVSCPTTAAYSNGFAGADPVFDVVP